MQGNKCNTIIKGTIGQKIFAVENFHGFVILCITQILVILFLQLEVLNCENLLPSNSPACVLNGTCSGQRDGGE